MKRVNQTVCTLVAACLLSATPAWAADSPNSAANAANQTQAEQFPQAFQKILDQLHQAVPELKELRLESTAYDENGLWGDTPVWHVEYTSAKENASKEEQKNAARAGVELDTKTGRILWFDIQSPAWASEKKPDDALVREKATAFMRVIWGDKASHFQASAHLGEGQSSATDSDGKTLYWTRSSIGFDSQINNIPIMNNSVRVSVDAAGHIVRYDGGDYSEVDQVKWTDPKSAISLEQAEKAYYEKVKMKLAYRGNQVVKYGEDRVPLERKPVLLYNPLAPYMLDALTGKPTDEPHAEKQERVKVAGEGKNVTVASRDEAEKWLKAALGIDVSGAEFELVDDKDRPNKKPHLQQIKRYFWEANGKPADGKPLPFKGVTILTDAQTNQIIDFDIRPSKKENDKTAKKLSQAEAQERALAFLQHYLDPKLEELLLDADDISPSEEEEIPSWVDKSKLDQDALSEDEEEVYSFAFNGLRNGIPVDDESYRVSVDWETGDITEFYLHPLEAGITLPAADKVVNADKAKEAYKQEVSLQLAYFWDEYKNQKAPQPQLVYILKEKHGFAYVDAPTGEIVRVTYP